MSKPSLVHRISQQRKAWSQPAFWSAPDVPWLSGYQPDKEKILHDFPSYVQAMKTSGPLFAAVDRRQQVFSQARFVWQAFSNGRLDRSWTDQSLALIENPWPGGTSGDLLAHMEYDASIAGNFYATNVDDQGRMGAAASGKGLRIARMRPDWVTLVVSSPSDDPYALDARVVGYVYRPVGSKQSDSVVLLPSEVCHYSPKPDPLGRFIGMSWMTPIAVEVSADKAATEHKHRFFTNGATFNVALKFPAGTPPEVLREYKALHDAEYKGTSNAYKTFFIAGADPVPISADLKQLDFKATQGAGETRIAVASGVPAVILGISEGLAGSSLNAGNFSAARRLFVDTTIRDLWAKAAPALQKLLPVPSGAGVKLGVEDRDIPFLREDAADEANIRQVDAVTLRQLIDAGYSPDAAVEFILTGGDLSKLKGKHSGLFSVQLQKPGEGSTMPDLAEGI